jgi:hypothetical protein
MATGYVLNEADVRLLRELVAQQRRGVRNTANRGRVEVETDPVAPEVYVARTPDAGVPQLAEVPIDLDTGTGSDFGTGTAVGVDFYAVPGSAVCDIYRMSVPAGGGDGTLSAVRGLTRRVYNLFGERVAGNRWVPVARDKYGQWFVTTLVAESADEYGDETGTGTGAEDDAAAPGDIDFYHNGVLVATRPAVNILDSSSLRFSVTDDPGNERVNVEAEADLVGTGTGGDPPTPTVTVINVTTIQQFDTYVQNVVYFNEYDQTVYVNVNNIWYQFCPCDEYGTGTGTGTGTVDPTADELVKVTADDTTAGYLDDKIVVGPNVYKTEVDPGGDETLRLACLDRLGEDTTQTGAVDDYALAEGYDVFTFSVNTSPIVLTGMAAPATGGGTWRVLRNLGGDGVGAETLTLTDGDAGSAAGNRFVNPAGGNIYVSPGGSVLEVYDGATGEWLTVPLWTGELLLGSRGLSPAAGTYDDYDLEGVTAAGIAGAGAYVYTGFAGGSQGRTHLVYNQSSNSTDTATINHNDGGSVAANRVSTSNGEDIVLRGGEAAVILHTGGAWRAWRLGGHPPWAESGLTGADGSIAGFTTGDAPVARTLSAWADLLTGDGAAADGDALVRDGGVWYRRAIGSAGDVLQVASGDPVWADLSGPLDALGSPANGDILVRSGGVWTLLPVGSDGDVLTLVSGAPAWVAP